MSDRGLNPSERETVILLNDKDEYAEISTHQKSMLTKLRRNPAAEEVETLTFGRTVGVTFRIPTKLLSIRIKAAPSGAKKANSARRAS